MKNKKAKKESRILRHKDLLITASAGILVFMFFSFFYANHLRFAEQLQLFLCTGNYFTEKLLLPGGLNGWTGSFLTQFYNIPAAGAFIISILFISIQLLTRALIREFNDGRKNTYLLSFLPALAAGLMLCNELYPLSAVTGFTASLAAAWVYTGIKNEKRRFAAGVILIPLIYYILGGAFLSMVLIMTAYEIILLKNAALAHGMNKERINKAGTGTGTGRTGTETAGKGRSWAKRSKLCPILLYIFLSAAVPLLVRYFFVFQPAGQAFFTEFYYNIAGRIPPFIPVLLILPLPVVLFYSLIPERHLEKTSFLIIQLIVIPAMALTGFFKMVNFDAERTMTYDQLVRNRKWEKVIAFAGKKPPGNYLSLAMLNLSLAKTGIMAEEMFSFSQHGREGLFLRFEDEFISPMMGNEILYHIGLVNASQLYAFESMEVMPHMEKSVRAVKRLAETNLINGRYEVAGKYLKLLEKTLFYRKWALNTGKYLYNEEMINNHPDWGEKRKMAVRKDFFFHIDDIEAILIRMLSENPGNRIAFEYLAAWYLLGRELDKFAGLVPLMQQLGYREMPRSCQEAMLFYISLTNTDPLAGSPYRISPDVIQRMNSYARIYLNNPDARHLLAPAYSDTYWYYFHYAE
ncbi:MAG TPA: DUF6057 family protein [Bacteroidales bacterium]|jgi:hypothetical protein|nr:DUF6057 family protein [Bacteroidales bacterium]HQH22706.1 DUF6057 family protein [Bacteroidales bacterium]HQJ82090.1 DUF6057 family protein [Bacteroidales bacterium]